MSNTSTINRSRMLAQELGQAIRHGRWAIGQPLPPTRQIAREQRMSLATVQVGLRELESVGLVERRPRRGVVVKSRLGRGGTCREITQQIGIVSRALPDQETGDNWTLRISRSAAAVVSDCDLHPVLLPPGSGENAHMEILRRIKGCGEHLRGIIAFNNNDTFKLLPSLDEMKMPWIVINRYDANTMHNFVGADNLRGCRLVGECLARLGLRRVLVLMCVGVNHSEAEKEKITGLIHGYLAMDAPINGIDYLLCGEEAPGKEIVRTYLEEHEPPEAVFSLNDVMASGAIAACVEAGLSVPDQVKIVGGVGLDIALHTRPTLTVIAQPMVEMGRQACEMLLEMIQMGKMRIDRRRIPGKLIVRESLPIPPDVRAALERNYPGMIE